LNFNNNSVGPNINGGIWFTNFVRLGFRNVP
jgi:hypothetical protein